MIPLRGAWRFPGAWSSLAPPGAALLGATLAGVLLAVAMLLLGSAAAQAPRFADQVAYVTQLGQLAVVHPTGGEPTLLSPVGAHYQFPAFSPAGDRIAAIAVAGGEAVIDVYDDEDVTRVYTSAAEPPIYLFWAPQGGALSFIANDADAGIGWWIWTREESARRVASGQPFYWDWDPDGSVAVAHTGVTGEEARLAFLDPEQGFAADDLAPPGLFQAPAIAPSRRWIAFGAVAPGPQTRVVVTTYPRFAGEVVDRSFVHGGFAAFDWNPAADVLAVLSPDSPAQTWFGPLELLDANEGLLERAIEETVLAFFWSPDGRKIAYLTAVRTGGAQQVARSAEGGLDSRLAQDARVRLRLKVAYVDGTVVEQVDTLGSFAPSRVFLEQFLPFFDQYARSHQVWSPGSDALVFPAVGVGGVTRVVRFGLDGEQRVLATGDMPFWNPR